MSLHREENATQTSTTETAEDTTSIRSLDMDVQNYIERTEDTDHEYYPGVERNEYDFTAERQSIYATNIVESIAHLIKGCLGAGILGIHEGYMFGGLWTSLVVNIIIGLIVSHNMLALINSAQTMYVRLRIPRLSYPDLAEVSLATGPLISCRRFSKGFRYTVDFFLFFGFCSTCCVFHIMSAHTLKEVLEAYSTKIKNWHLSINLYTLAMALPLIIISMIRSLKYLAPFSLAADFFCGFCVLTTIYYSLMESKDIRERPAWKSVHGFFRVCGVCIYSVDGIGVALPIENHMKSPRYFFLVIQWGMSIVIISVAIVGFFGFWAWGESCSSPITMHIPKNQTSSVMQILFTASLMVTFAVHLWVPFKSVWHYIGKRHKSRRGHWERLYKAIYVILLTCLSIIFPDLNRWMSFVGNFFLGPLVFIFPAFIESLVIWKEPRLIHVRLKLIKNAFMILFGVVLLWCALFL